MPLSEIPCSLKNQVDGVTQYIDWAISQKFGIMDINIPAYVTGEEV